jgi:transposase
LLARALTGDSSEHHALHGVLDAAGDRRGRRHIALSREIDRQLEPLRQQLNPLITIPGVSLLRAQVLIADINVGMGRFATTGHLAFWAGMCPGNKESAGKRLSGRTRHGDTWLETALFMAGTRAARGKHTCLSAQFRRLDPYRGPKRATIAVGHS